MNTVIMPDKAVPVFRLSEINQPRALEVKSVEGRFTCRLLEMGIIPGATVSFVRSAPLKFPIEIEVDGNLLVLREEEASGITVAG